MYTSKGLLGYLVSFDQIAMAQQPSGSTVYPSTFLPRYSGPDIPRDRLYYVSSIRYPRIPQPQPIDRILRILLHVWQTIYSPESHHGFYWAEIVNPATGDCYCIQRQGGNATAFNSGGTIANVDVQNGVFGEWPIEFRMNLETHSSEPHDTPTARLEYRLAIPNNSLVFIQFIPAKLLQNFHPFKPSGYPITPPNYSATLNAMLAARAALFARASMAAKPIDGAYRPAVLTPRPQAVEILKAKTPNVSKGVKKPVVRAPTKSPVDHNIVFAAQVFLPLFNDESQELLSGDYADHSAGSLLRKQCRDILLTLSPCNSDKYSQVPKIAPLNLEDFEKTPITTILDDGFPPDYFDHVDGKEDPSSIVSKLTLASKYYKVRIE